MSETIQRFFTTSFATHLSPYKFLNCPIGRAHGYPYSQQMQRLQWSFWSLKCHRCFLLPPLSSCATMWATSIFAYLYMCRCRRSSCHFASSTHIISVDGHFPAALAVFYITQQFFCFFLNNIFLYLLWSTALTFFAAAKSCLFAISSNAECSTFIFSLRTTTPTFWQLICRFSTVYSIYYMTYLLTYTLTCALLMSQQCD